jgi:hypothetical protein
MAREEPALLERLGTRYLSRGSATSAAVDEVHVLNPEERAALGRIVHGAVWRAALAGVVNAILTGFGALYASRLLGARPEHATFTQLASYWGAFGALAALFAVVEIAYLYWDALRAVRALSSAAGLELNAEASTDVARALARAALELPNPPDASFGINPYREASKLQLALAPIVYKLKISATNFVFKALVQRALGRFLARSLLEFTAIPINAAWNALVCWFVLREARIRVMGPSAAIELLAAAFEGEAAPSRAVLCAVHQAMGSAVVRTTELHPNHIALMRRYRERFGDPDAGLVLDDPSAFLAALPALEPAERKIVIRMLAAAASLDGRLVRREKELLTKAYASAGLEPRLDKVHALRRAFVTGSGSMRAALRETA